jgi:hypothetical protein
MAASLPSLDQMTDARPEEYLPDQYQTLQFATLSNGAQGEVASPQGDLSFQTLWDAIRAQADTPTPYIDHGGKLGCRFVLFPRFHKLMNDEPWHRSFHFRTLAVRHHSVMILLWTPTV